MTRVCGADDIADAFNVEDFAALWTAERIARGEAPPRDRHGLRMAIVA